MIAVFGYEQRAFFLATLCAHFGVAGGEAEMFLAQMVRRRHKRADGIEPSGQKLRDYRNGLIVASRGSDCLGRSGVDGALKVLHYGVRCIIAKWKYLHHDYRAGFPGRVNPEKGVVDTSPRQGPAGTAAFDGLGVDSKSQAKLIQRTGDANGIFGELRYLAP